MTELEEIIKNINKDKSLCNLIKYRLISKLYKEESDLICYKIEEKNMTKNTNNFIKYLSNNNISDK